MTRMTLALKEKLARVRLFLCDVDGVLTDGTVQMVVDMILKVHGHWAGLLKEAGA
jgi:hypothetical protein